MLRCRLLISIIKEHEYDDDDDNGNDNDDDEKRPIIIKLPFC